MSLKRQHRATLPDTTTDCHRYAVLIAAKKPVSTTTPIFIIWKLSSSRGRGPATGSIELRIKEAHLLE